MPFQGSSPTKTFSRTTGLKTGSTAWAQTEAAGRGVMSADEDTHDQDIADAISTSWQVNGANQPTANLPMNGFKLTGHATPSASADVATKGYVDSQVVSAVNATVRIASTATVTKASAMDNGKTVDGVVLATNDRVLLKNQSSAAENGVWVVAASGAPARATDFDTWAEFVGAIVNVTAGSTNANTSWRFASNSGGTLDTTAISFLQFGTSITLPVPVASGGTGSTDAATAFAALKVTGTTAATGVLQLATNAEVITGTDTAKAATAAGVAAAIAAAPNPAPCIILEDQKASGTDGGAFNSGADRTRTLNTEVRDSLSICTLSSNQFTITTAGTYYIKWSAPAGDLSTTTGHQSMLYDVTGTAVLKRGMSIGVDGVASQFTIPSTGQHVVAISGSNTFEIRHRVGASSNGTKGFGRASGFGTEIYTVVEIWKVG